MQSPSTSRGSQGPTNIGQASGVTWQTGDLSLATPFPFEQLVPIGDRLFLITSDNGSAAGPTAKPSGGIWSTADGLAWTKESDIDAIKSSGTDRQTLTAAAPNGRGGAVVVGSAQTVDGVDRTAAWWTADGKTWANASVEGPAGRMYSVVGRPDGLSGESGSPLRRNAVPRPRGGLPTADRAGRTSRCRAVAWRHETWSSGEISSWRSVARPTPTCSCGPPPTAPPGAWWSLRRTRPSGPTV